MAMELEPPFEMVRPGREAVEDEDMGAERIADPFDPLQIRIETKQLSIDLLIKRIRDKRVDLTTAFQRGAGLWTDRTQSRLIESILVRIPIPAFYFDATDEERWLVVDGLQRLTALRRFAVDDELALEELEFLRQFEGKKFAKLPRPMQRRIEETQVSVYLIQPGAPDALKFNIFKRINTEGLPLSPQEIRHALNQGPAADLLGKLAASREFQQATADGIHNKRMVDRECVLRFMAFALVSYGEYKTQDLDGFLNAQMRALNKMGDAERFGLERRFLRSMKAATAIFGDDAFRKRYRQGDARMPINKALFESWSVNLDAVPEGQLQTLFARKAVLREAFIGLMNDRAFEAAVTQATGDVRKVKLRFSKVAEIIQGTLV